MGFMFPTVLHQNLCYMHVEVCYEKSQMLPKYTSVRWTYAMNSIGKTKLKVQNVLSGHLQFIRQQLDQHRMVFSSLK